MKKKILITLIIILIIISLLYFFLPLIWENILFSVYNQYLPRIEKTYGIKIKALSLSYSFPYNIKAKSVKIVVDQKPLINGLIFFVNLVLIKSLKLKI